MGTKKTLDERIQATQTKLAQLKLQEQKRKQRERSEHEKAMTRRKIELGGVVIASGADDMDPAELCGILLTAKRTITPEKLHALREMGLAHFESRRKK